MRCILDSGEFSAFFVIKRTKPLFDVFTSSLQSPDMGIEIYDFFALQWQAVRDTFCIFSQFSMSVLFRCNDLCTA